MADQSLPAPARAAAPSARVKRRFVVGGVVLAIALAALVYWAHERHYQDTDDAQIDGNISSVSPRISGNVRAVYVTENVSVQAGDVLAEVDPVDLRIALDEAKAQVAQAQAQLEAEDPSLPMTLTSNESALATARSDVTGARAALSAARKEVAQLTAQLVQARANDNTAQLEKERSQKLIAEGAVSQSDYDQRSNAAAASTASLDALEQALAAASDRVAQQQAQIVALESHFGEISSNGPRQAATRRASVVVRAAALDVAKAQLAQAEQNLSYARILSPAAGVVAKKSISLGDHVTPGQQVIAISQTDSLWVTANFRETQLQSIVAGQPATIHVDALGADLRGSVESIGGATGSRLSVLPPENASGNYVKVVQRVPVRIQIEPGQPGFDRLRIGMSVEPRVTVR